MNLPRALTIALFFPALLSSAFGGENLIKDGSFENTKARDRNGLVFNDWQGNVYEGACQFDVGQVAHSGKSSCEMTGNGKIRVFTPEFDLAPGRYRASAWIRGFNVAASGSMGNYSMDFCADGSTFVPVRGASETFDWRPFHYVFELKEAKKARVFIGLCANGRVWVDDVVLEKAANDAQLTPQVVFDAEPKPIAAPGDAGPSPLKCRACGSKNNPQWPHCYVCGAEIGTKKFTTPLKMPFIELKDGGIAPFFVSDGGSASLKNTPDGERAIFLEKGWAEVERINGKMMDWSEHDLIHIDVYNPTDTARETYVEVRDSKTVDYYSRVNYYGFAPPGKSTITIPTNMYTGEKAKPGRSLYSKEISRFVVAGSPPLYYFNFTLERLDTANVVFDELRALSFGPSDAPVCEGFEHATTGTRYSADRGYGWDGVPDFWRDFNVLQPDLLTQSFVCMNTAKFRVDVPDGKYRVMTIIDSPGGYWGEVQTYKNRQVSINGKPWISEAQTYESFKQHYWQNAHHEDLPGVDAFDTYIKPNLPWRSTSVDVTGGKLELDFASSGAYGISLSALVIFPESKAAEGDKFVNWANERRKIQFSSYFRQVIPKRTGEAAPKDGYTLFHRHFMATPRAYDGPQAGEVIGPEGLSQVAALGEEIPITFSVQPGSDLGPIDLQISALKSESGAALDASALQAGWLSNRIIRGTMEGTMYSVGPRYWHPMPAPASKGVTRTFWIRTRIPENTAPGTYKGIVTVKPQTGKEQSIPLTLTVRPFKLDPITDVAAGPFAYAMFLPFMDCPELRQWDRTMLEKSLDALREAGCTSLSGLPNLRYTLKDGKVTLDTTLADVEMKLLRAKGFKMISTYGLEGLPYAIYGNASGPDENAAKAGGFSDATVMIKAIYKTIDDHAVANDWLPIAWNLCDEPMGDALPGAMKNALAHRAAMEGLKRTTFTGFTSMEGNDPKDPHYELVKALPIPSLNLHDEKSLGVVHDAKNTFSFYNGGTRWTFGRYLKMLVAKHGLTLRLTWHFHGAAGDPYNALDCREDDYCWYNSDADGRMVPSMTFLSEIIPGLNDYRYLSTLERLLKEKPGHAAHKQAEEVFKRMIALEAGKDRDVESQRMNANKAGEFEKDMAEVAGAIEGMMK